MLSRVDLTGRRRDGSEFPAHIALYPNLSITDPVWRALLRDVRFRRALSLAINRKEINDVIYFGLAIEGNNTVLPQSPLFREHYETETKIGSVEILRPRATPGRGR